MLTKEEILEKAVPTFVCRYDNDLTFDDWGKRAVTHIGDLSVMYEVDHHGLTKKDMQKADVSMDELASSIPDAMDRKGKAIVRSLENVLSIKDEPEMRAYVICAPTSGAEIVCGKDAQQKLSGFLPEGYYLIPSSTHEMIAVSKKDFSASELQKILIDVNRTLDKKDILSDNIFDIEDGKLHCVTEEKEIIKSPADEIRRMGRNREKGMDYER